MRSKPVPRFLVQLHDQILASPLTEEYIVGFDRRGLPQTGIVKPAKDRLAALHHAASRTSARPPLEFEHVFFSRVSRSGVLTAEVTGIEGPKGPSDRASSIPEEGGPTVICRWEIVLPAALTSPTFTYIGSGACFAAFVNRGFQSTHLRTFLRPHC